MNGCAPGLALIERLIKSSEMGYFTFLLSCSMTLANEVDSAVVTDDLFPKFNG